MSATYDLHQHLWPPALIDALRRRAEPPRLRGSLLQLVAGEWEVDLTCHDPENRLASLDRDEIDIALLSCPPTLELDAELTDAYHRGILDVVGASGGRLRALSCDALLPGFDGACVAAQSLTDLEAIAPLLGRLEDEGKLLFVHPGPEPFTKGAPSWWQAVVGYTAQMQAAYASWLAYGVNAWPRLRVLFAILAGGAPFQLERLASRGIDTRTVLHEHLYFDTASYADRALGLTFATYGVGQVVYGSDWPVIDAETTLRSVRGLGEAVVDAVCRDNPSRLLA